MLNFWFALPPIGAIDEIVIRISKEIKNFKNEKVIPSFVRLGSTTNKSVLSYTLDGQSSQSLLSQANKFGKKPAVSKASIICSTLSSCVSEYND